MLDDLKIKLGKNPLLSIIVVIVISVSGIVVTKKLVFDRFVDTVSANVIKQLKNKYNPSPYASGVNAEDLIPKKMDTKSDIKKYRSWKAKWEKNRDN